jgi:hypothetical protein
VLACVPLFGKSGYADLSSQFTDHLHHVYGVWLIWKHGLLALTTPFGQLSGEGFAHPIALWPETPWMYPPGTVLLFAPLTALAQLVPLSLQQLATATVLYLSVWSHLGFYLYADACRRFPPGERLFLTAVGWLMLMRLTLEGFYDPLWLGAGAAVVGCASRGRYERALLWFALAASLHYRAAVYAPAGAYAFFAIVLRRPPRSWPRGVLAVVLLSCLATVTCFVLMYPASAAYRAIHPPLLPMLRSVFFVLLLLLTVAIMVQHAWLNSWVGALSVLLFGLIALSDFRGYLGYWHHAPTMLAAPVAAGLGLREPAAQLCRASALFYGFAVSRMVWGYTPFELLYTLADKLQWLLPPAPP